MTGVPFPRRALVLLGVLTLVWGTSWPLFVLAVREVSVWTFRAVAVTVSGSLLLLVARLRGQSLVIPRRHWPTVGLATCFYLVLWNICSTYSAVWIPSGQAAVLGFTMPLWTVVLSWAVRGDRPDSRRLLALALGAASVTLLMVPSFAVYRRAPLGMVLGLVAGLGWAIGTLILASRRIMVSAVVLTGWQLLFTAVPTTVGALWFAEGGWFVPSWTTVLVIAYIALVPMSIGNAAWFAIVGLLPPDVAGLSAILVPVVAMVAGAVVHAEPLGPPQWLAIVCCVGSLWLVVRVPRAATGSADAV